MQTQHSEQDDNGTLEVETRFHGLDATFPGIESTPGICGGAPRIVRTRIPVWVLVQARRLGVSEAELLRWYPTLEMGNLVNAWAYFEAHSEEIDEQIRRNEEA